MFSLLKSLSKSSINFFPKETWKSYKKESLMFSANENNSFVRTLTSLKMFLRIFFAMQIARIIEKQ
jgi:hypothetical protein